MRPIVNTNEMASPANPHPVERPPELMRSGHVGLQLKPVHESNRTGVAADEVFPWHLRDLAEKPLLTQAKMNSASEQLLVCKMKYTQ